MPNTNSPPPQSFIPREASVGVSVPRAQGRGLGDLFVLIAIVLFVASVALAIGVSLYNGYLQSSATSKLSQLERAKSAFEPSLIQELTRLDDRMRTAGEILNKHISPSAFFDMLEQSTITSVAFNSLDFNASDPAEMTIGMAGVAGSVNAIALQADLFSKGGTLVSPIFSNINRQADGVHFSFSGTLSPASVNYIRVVGEAAAAASVLPDISSFAAPPAAGAVGSPATPLDVVQDENAL